MTEPAATERIILVTGGGGFLGAAIVRQLLARGDRVRSFSRRFYPQLAALGVEQQQGDLNDPAAVQRAVRGVHAVIHAAAKPGVYGSYDSYYQTNTVGTQLVIGACRALGVRYLVYTSSPSVTFAGADQEGVDESTPLPKKFLAFYAQTKALGEVAVREANGAELLTVALRPHLIWGPGDQHLLPRLLERARQGKLRLIGDGRKLVDAVYIDNAAVAHLQALASLEHLGEKSPAAGQVYYISNDEPWPTGDLINAMLAANGLPPVQKSVPAWLGIAAGRLFEWSYRLLGRQAEPPLTNFMARQLATAHWYNIAAAKRDFGYRPVVSMNEGMQRLRTHSATHPGHC